MCHNKEEIGADVELKIKEYAERGLRTLGVAQCILKNVDDDEGMEFI